MKRSRKRCPVDVFRFLDYRAFLTEFYRAKKRRGYSYRAFSEAAGAGAPNYLKLVIDGRRNLAPAMAARFADACALEGESAAYFLTLVEFNQASTNEQRNDAYDRLNRFRRYRRAQKLEVAQAAFHSTWYVPAIRELIQSSQFREDPAWIAAQLRPPIEEAQARHALDVLLQIGLVVRDEDGSLCVRDAVVSTGPQTRGLHMANYHRGMLERAASSIELFAAAERDISSLTLGLTEDGVAQVKERVKQFRRELLELAASTQDPSRVLQLNFQVFPLTAPLDETETTGEEEDD